jgi:hypothetical protein
VRRAKRENGGEEEGQEGGEEESEEKSTRNVSATPERGAAAHNQRKSRLWHQQPGCNYFVDAYDLCNNVVLSFLLIILPLFFSPISEPYQRFLI